MTTMMFTNTYDTKINVKFMSYLLKTALFYAKIGIGMGETCNKRE
jgi:hypothetical protein